MSAVGSELVEAARPDFGQAPASMASVHGTGRTKVYTALTMTAVLGLILRISISGWPLWNDEIWSLQNLQGIDHFWQIFWAISHDNNHTLNSLWLFLAQPLSENPTWLRAPSILAGMLTIPVMARLGGRHGAASAIAAATFVGFSFFFTILSVEARGYAEAILATAIGYDALERAIENPKGNSRVRLALAVGVGLFCHLGFVVATTMFGLAVVCETLRRTRDLRAGLTASFTILWPTAFATIPAIACFLVGYLTVGFRFGSLQPFTSIAGLFGLSDLVRLIFGLPHDAGMRLAITVVAPFAVMFAIFRIAPRDRRTAYFLFLIVVPVIVFVVRPPNVIFARYYFSSAVFLALLVADCFGALWYSGGLKRSLATAVLMASVAGGCQQTFAFVRDQQHAWPEALETIRASGHLRFAGIYLVGHSKKIAFFGQDKSNQHEIYYFNQKHSPQVELAEPSSYCADAPSWLILGNAPRDAVSPQVLSIGGDLCHISYTWTGVFDATDVGDERWALYQLTRVE
jgi:hypothetical protein